MNIRITIALSWLLFLVAMSASKSVGYGHIIWGTIETFLGGNRQMHFSMALISSVLCYLATPSGSLRLLVLVGLMVGGAVDELLQWLLPLRSFNPLDFGATVAGFLVGWMLIAFVCWGYLRATRPIASSHSD